MRKIFAWIFFSSAFLFAEADLWNSPADFQSQEVLQVMQTFAKTEKMHGSFKQKRIVPKIDRSFESSGKYEISAEDGIVFDTQKPFASKLEISKTKIVQTFADGSKSEMNAADNAIFREIAKTFQAVFCGDTSAIQERFQAYFVSEKGKWNIGLTPKENAVKKAIASISLSGKKVLEKMEIVDGEGNILTYEFR